MKPRWREGDRGEGPGWREGGEEEREAVRDGGSGEEAGAGPGRGLRKMLDSKRRVWRRFGQDPILGRRLRSQDFPPVFD